MSTIDGRTLSFWASIYTLVLSIAILSDRAIGQLLDGPIGDGIGLASAAATVLLWVGWWGQRHRVIRRVVHGRTGPNQARRSSGAATATPPLPRHCGRSRPGRTSP